MGSLEARPSTYIFDHSLLMNGRWDDKARNILLEWIKTPDGEKRAVAAKKLGDLIKHFLGDDISERGVTKADNIEENLMHLENILSTTKGGIVKKFYRDHLNHSIRVLLLASCLAESITDFDISEVERKHLNISAIFHDFSYPLSEVYEIYNAIIKGMREIYDSVTFPDFICSDNSVLLCSLLSIIDLSCGLTLVKIGEELANRNHSVLSSLEFLSYIKAESWGKYTDALKAILIHDPSFNIKIDFSNEKISSLLIIADELQDWGRISSFENTLTIDEIREFTAENSKIYGEMKWDNTSTLSPLRQIYAKQQSLNRLSFNNDSTFEMEINYILPIYEIVNYASFEMIISKLLSNYEHPENLYKNFSSVDVFEEKYFGVVGEEYAKVMRYLLDYDGEHSYFKDYNMHFSIRRNELWLLQQELSNPIQLSLILKNKVSLKVKNKEFERNGVLYHQYDSELLDLYKQISKHLSILNEISFEHINTPPYRIPPRNANDFQEKMARLGLSNPEIELVNCMNVLPSIFRSQGFFSFYEHG